MPLDPEALHDRIPSDHYDTVTCVEVLEHLLRGGRQLGPSLEAYGRREG